MSLQCSFYKIIQLSVVVIMLKPYEIAKNWQTTNQSKLHTTVQSNSIYLLSYNDLFVFVLMHTLYAWQVISSTTTCSSRRIIEPISRILYTYLFLSFSYKVVLCQYSLFCITTLNVIFVYSYRKTNISIRINFDIWWYYHG